MINNCFRFYGTSTFSCFIHLHLFLMFRGSPRPCLLVFSLASGKSHNRVFCHRFFHRQCFRCVSRVQRLPGHHRGRGGSFPRAVSAGSDDQLEFQAGDSGNPESDGATKELYKRNCAHGQSLHGSSMRDRNWNRMRLCVRYSGGRLRTALDRALLSLGWVCL